MRKGGGSKKGSSFEREICKQLSLWWTDGTRDDVFWRTAGSGGRATNRAKIGKETAGAYGDLTFTDPIGADLLKLCCFELKRGYGQWGVLDLVDRPKHAKSPTIANFWLQAKNSAQEAGVPYPVVIFRRDQKQTAVMAGRDFLAVLAPYSGPHRGIKILTSIGADQVFIMSFSDWLDYTNPQVMRSLL